MNLRPSSGRWALLARPGNLALCWLPRQTTRPATVWIFQRAVVNWQVMAASSVFPPPSPSSSSSAGADAPVSSPPIDSDDDGEVDAAVVDALREKLLAYVKGTDSRQLSRVASTIWRRKYRRCRLVPQPTKVAKGWTPKHPEVVKSALALVRQGVGVRESPRSVPTDEWTAKLLSYELVERIRVGESGDRCEQSKLSVSIAALLKRLVSKSLERKASDPGRFAGAQIALQHSGDDAGWMKVVTRGSGVAFNDAGRALFMMVADDELVVG